MTPEPEDAAIIRDLVAIFPEMKEQVGDLDLVYEVAGAFARRACPARIRRARRSRSTRVGQRARDRRVWGMEVVMDFPETDPVARSLLGERGTELWESVRRFWHGA